MNAVFQQLYMQPGLPEVSKLSAWFLPALVTRGHLVLESSLSFILCIQWQLGGYNFQAFLSIEDDTDQPEESVFYQVQSLFGHLMESKLQYYIPENFWKVTWPLLSCWWLIVLSSKWGNWAECWCDSLFPSLVNPNVKFLHLLQIFKMWNKELYVREQQDAYEFFTSLVDQLDEHLKVKAACTHWKNDRVKLNLHIYLDLWWFDIWQNLFKQKMGREQIFKNTFQGIFSDQKICKDCPHR